MVIKRLLDWFDSLFPIPNPAFVVYKPTYAQYVRAREYFEKEASK